MAKSDPTKKIELEPDAWSRFERAVDVVAKSPPQHRIKAKRKSGKSPGKRKAKQRTGRWVKTKIKIGAEKTK